MITCLTPSHRSFKLYPILHSTPHYQALGTAAVIQTVSAMGASLHCFLHHSRGNSHAQPESSELLSYLVKQSVHNGILDDRQEAVGRTPLMLAATYGSPASMSVLLSAGANATERDSYNRSVLCMAVVSGDETKVSVALDALTDDDRRRQLEETTCGPVDEFGWSLHRGLLSFPVLTVAVEQDNEAVVNRLIAAGSPLTSEPKGTQPSSSLLSHIRSSSMWRLLTSNLWRPAFRNSNEIAAVVDVASHALKQRDDALLLSIIDTAEQGVAGNEKLRRALRESLSRVLAELLDSNLWKRAASFTPLGLDLLIRHGGNASQGWTVKPSSLFIVAHEF